MTAYEEDDLGEDVSVEGVPEEADRDSRALSFVLVLVHVQQLVLEHRVRRTEVDQTERDHERVEH